MDIKIIKHLYNNISETLEDIIGEFDVIETVDGIEDGVFVRCFSKALKNMNIEVVNIINKIKTKNVLLTGKFTLFFHIKDNITLSLNLYTKDNLLITIYCGDDNKSKMLYSHYAPAMTDTEEIMTNKYLYTPTLNIYLLYKHFIEKSSHILQQDIVSLSIYDYYKSNTILDFLHKECTNPNNKSILKAQTATNKEYVDIYTIDHIIRVSICSVNYIKILTTPNHNELRDIRYSFDFKNKVINIYESEISDGPYYNLIKEIVEKLNGLIVIK